MKMDSPLLLSSSLYALNFINLKKLFEALAFLLLLDKILKHGFGFCLLVKHNFMISKKIYFNVITSSARSLSIFFIFIPV